MIEDATGVLIVIIFFSYIFFLVLNFILDTY